LKSWGLKKKELEELRVKMDEACGWETEMECGR
jgi:hypothetical protein